MTPSEAITRLMRVESELRATSMALSDAIGRVRNDPTIIARVPTLTLADLRLAERFAEATYLVRLFTEFEAILREYWTTIRPSDPAAKDLIEAIVAPRGVPPLLRLEIHAVREQRNTDTHRGKRELVVAFTRCRSVLCRFLAYLPRSW